MKTMDIAYENYRLLFLYLQSLSWFWVNTFASEHINFC